MKRRLAADVPVGLFVSGGLNSGIVAAFAAKANNQLQCFSIGFDEPSFDESAYSKQVATSLGIRHHLTIFSSGEMLQLVQKCSSTSMRSWRILRFSRSTFCLDSLPST